MSRSRFAIGVALLGAFFVGCFDHTFVVNSLVDAHDLNPGDGVCESAAGECTLRAAIEEADALEGYDLVSVPAGVFFLTLGELVVNEGVAIAGAGWEDTIIDAGGNSRILRTQEALPEKAALIGISGLTMRNGKEVSGGALMSIGNHVTLSNVVIRDCVAQVPGRAFGLGGGVYHQGGVLRVQDSLILNNASGQYGGGILSDVRSTLIVERSSIMGNTSYVSGGGISTFGGPVNMRLVKLYGNSSHFGGALSATPDEPGADLVIEKTRFRGNNSFEGSGALSSHVATYVSDTEFSRNIGPDCEFPVIDLGGNSDADGTCLP